VRIQKEEFKGNSWSYSPATKEDKSKRISKETTVAVRVELPVAAAAPMAKQGRSVVAGDTSTLSSWLPTVSLRPS
jgi:hypothetical protein